MTTFYFILLFLYFIVLVVVCYSYMSGSQRVLWEPRREASNQTRAIREHVSGMVKLNLNFEE